MPAVLAVAALAVGARACASGPPPGEADAPDVVATPPRPPLAIVPIAHRAGADAMEVVSQHARRSIAAGRYPVVQMWASWCPSCQEVDAALARDDVRGELPGVEILRLDVDAWMDALRGTPLAVSAVPTFLQVAPDGTLTGQRITSAAWDDVVTMPAVLRAFAHTR